VSASGSISSSVKVVAAQQLSLSRGPDAPHFWEKGGLVELGGFVASEDQRHALHALVREASPSRKIEDKLKIGLPMVNDFM